MKLSHLFLGITLSLSSFFAALTAAGADCENSWSLETSLNWSGAEDYDHKLRTPNTVIYHGNLSDDGFTLNHDAHRFCEASPLPPETITGMGSCGTYTIEGDDNETFAEGDGCLDPSPPVFYSATITVLKPITINGIPYQPGDEFHPDNKVPFTVELSTSATSSNVKPNDLKSGGNQQTDDCGMARYSVHSMLVSLNIEDTPVGYAPPRGPAINFTVTYNQKESGQPEVFDYSNLGPKWTFNWLAHVTDNPQAQDPTTSVHVAGGGAEIFAFNTPSQTFAPDPQSHAILVRTSADSYERRMPDGSKQIFDRTDGATSSPRKVFMTRWVDATGNAVNIGYDASLRVATLTDALGQITSLSYELGSDPFKITRVTDPFGRFATFAYLGGKLVTITDVVGIQSHFTYLTDSDFIDSLTTPYGTTTFVSGENGTNRWLETTDPLGGKERVEFRDQAPGISANEPVAPAGVVNASLDVANTFFWDKKAMLMAPGDYTKAKITHWLLNADESVSGIVSSEKKALENRAWFTYANQPDYQHAGPSANPSKSARILGDGTTQLFQFEYNGLGNTTKSIDPVGRTLTNIYDTNQIDLLEVRQTTGASNELLKKLTYNNQHLPLTETDAAGQVTTFTYTAFGQVLTRKNAKNETTTFAYGGAAPAGYLASITSPPFSGNSAVTSFGYDSLKRVRTVTDSDGYIVTTAYDNLDRKTTVTYPDTTFEEFRYTDNATGVMTLDMTASRDRRGLWTYRDYNANQQLESVKDPANRTTKYGWCTCGALETITDAKNQVTTFHRDLQSRVHQKVFADGTTINYLYDGQTAPNTAGATSRLQSSTDAKGQRTNRLYCADDKARQISYTNIAGQPLNPSTPTVSYTYDPNHNRVVSMADGTGTTIYTYHPITASPALGAGQLASIDGPLANDTVTYSYDQLGRTINRSIDGAINSRTWSFDSLGRVSSEVNKLGTFTNTYIGVTSRLSKVLYPGGVTSNYLYFPNGQDRRLQQIKHLTNNNKVISQFDHTYDPEGQLKTWTQDNPSLKWGQRFDLGYDDADQLLSAPLRRTQNNNKLITEYSYGYDPAGNRTLEQVDNAITAATPNNVNQVVSQTGGTNRTLTYDLNGNLTNDGAGRTFEWDAANRLAAINYTGTTGRSEFAYDGFNRMTKIVEKTGATITSTRKFIWCGTEKCEFRDANNTVTLRVYPQGQHTGTTPYFFTRDHLGSVREMFNGAGTVVARYEYDPYGRSTTVIGTTPADFNFTGLYRHSRSNLDLATYRAYDPDLGRWLSRDPAEEKGGINLYGYAANNPLNMTDQPGLCPGDWWDPRTWFNEGLMDSFWDSGTSISDSLGGMAAYPLYGEPAWQQVMNSATYSPLGQTEDNPAAYRTVWGALIVSGATDSVALGGWGVARWTALSPGAKFEIINTIMKIATGEGETTQGPTRLPPPPPPYIGGP